MDHNVCRASYYKYHIILEALLEQPRTQINLKSQNTHNKFNQLFVQYIYQMNQNPCIESDNLKKQIKLLLIKLNKKNTYQILLILFMSFAYIMCTFASMIAPFVFMNPIFQRNNQIVCEQQACKDIESFTIVNNFTGSYYAGLYCQQEYVRSTIQSAQFFGSLVSLLTLIPISDSKGRKFTLIISMILFIFGLSFIIIGIYWKIIILMIIGQFLNGAFFACMNAMCYVITGQFTDDKMRQRAIMIYCAMWGLGEALFLPIYYLMPQWYNFLILAMLIPSSGVLTITFFFVVETPTFCIFNAKDYKKFSHTVDMISMYNKSSDQDVYEIKNLAKKYINQCQKEEKNKISFKESMKLLGKRQILVTIFCISLSQSAFNVFYFGMQGSMERTGYNYGISMFIAGVHQFLGYLIVGIFVHKLPRKKSLIGTIIISSLIGLTFILPLVKNSQIFETIIISVVRLCTVFGYTFVVLFQTQSFSENIKSTAFGLTEGLSQISKLLVPYFIVMMNDKGIHPLIFSSAFYLIVGTLPVFMLKQTLNKHKQSNATEKVNDKEEIKTEDSLTQVLIQSCLENDQNRTSIN